MQGFVRLEESPEAGFFELAARHADPARAALLVIGADAGGAQPTVQQYVKLQKNTHVAEADECFGLVTDNIMKYKTFILAGLPLNSFEVEFFRQLCAALDRQILWIQVHGK
ncbi:hypothetical protein PAPHI01_2181 [Pancytospora philotis]|nr:hypothetical protein PAPHI01_2181 [Pancytospora philotis]